MEAHELLLVLSQPETLGPRPSQTPTEQVSARPLCRNLPRTRNTRLEASQLVPTAGSLSMPTLLSLQDINAYNGDQPEEKLPFPIIADAKRELAVKLGMLDPDERDKDGMPLTARVVSAWLRSTAAAGVTCPPAVCPRGWA